MKFFDASRHVKKEDVAPYAGAWIEILLDGLAGGAPPVAPYAGAWIEILYFSDHATVNSSLPTRERGLKFMVLKACFTASPGRSLRGSVD